MNNFFLALWNPDLASIAVAVLAGCVALSGVLMSINVFRHEGSAGAIAPKHRMYAVFCVAGAVIAGAIGTLLSHAVAIWISIHALGAISVCSLSLYERNTNGVIARRLSVRLLLGALLSAFGLVVLTYNPLQFGSMELVARTAFVCTLLGYGVSLGLAPMHAGLAELYSKIPSPIAALVAPLTTILGVYGMLRLRIVVDGMLADGGVWTGGILLFFGVLTVVVLAGTLVWQKNYKKYFAELLMFHVGILIAFMGMGVAGTIPALMHLSATAVLGSSMFALSGILHATYKTTKFSGLRNTFSLLPLTAGALVFVLLGSIGMPVSGMFMSMMIGMGYGLQFHIIATAVLMCAWIVVMSSVAARVLALRMSMHDDALVLLPVRWKISPIVVVLQCGALFALSWYIGTQNGIRFFVDIAQGLSTL